MALLSLAFDTGLRGSEIVAIRWAHVERGAAGGGRLFVPRSKSDQDGADAYAYLSARTMTALPRWRNLARPGDGAVFRRLHRARDRAGEDVWTVGAGLSAQSVTLIYCAMLDAAHAAGRLGTIDATDFDAWRRAFTAHSTRVGPTQELTARRRTLVCLDDEDVCDLARADVKTGLYKRSMRLRRGVQRFFADAKGKHGMRRLHLRGIRGAEEKFLIGAAVMNLMILARPNQSNGKPRRGVCVPAAPTPAAISTRSIEHDVIVPPAGRYA